MSIVGSGTNSEGEIASALLRSRVYGFLRRVFTNEVDEAFLSWCRDQDQLGLWSELEFDFQKILENADSEVVVDTLAVDFCRLFITSGAAGSPHESVQRASPDELRLLWGDPTSAAKCLYREAGFELEERADLLPDSLGVEFEFMERLSQEEATARKKGRSAAAQRCRKLQRRMLKEHLSRWVPDYGRKLSGAADTAFYREMLRLAADFVEWDTREQCQPDESDSREP